ncbi:hypothetical protein [Salinicoccus kekensis]|uniref:Phospholipase A2-like protein n=1 Tax=Salinicoccus kekensis TaxID=714307 RepID=A0A285UTG7_9STAP|nr:hypothetical protein [Salinicoccus kekensis]SOC45109.1 hypothetical protein SAMN05878391_2612 [Salinicoccus kekensis]
MKKLFLIFMTFSLLVSGVSSAEASTQKVDENSSFEETQLVLEQYITRTKDGEIKFDVEEAKDDGQSEFIIGTGQKINQVNQAYNKKPGEVTVMALSLPVWGNWCGPGHGGGGTKDVLDNICKQHDLDYRDYGYFDCGSDKRLMSRIIAQTYKMKFLEKQMAYAVFAYFQAQSATNGCY